MTAYTALLSARLRTLLQYRAAAFAGLVTQGMFGTIRIMIFTAFYASSPDRVHPLTLTQIVTYVWLGQALFNLVPFRSDGDVTAMIRDGSVAYELARPVDVYGMWYMRAIALRTAPTLLRAVPMVIIALWLVPDNFAMTPPASWLAALWFAFAVGFALLLSAAITTLLNISMMWTVSGEGAAYLLQTTAWLLSGIVIPLPLCPEPIARVLELLPFAGLMDVPLRFYLGDIAAADVGPVLLRQALWGLALIGLGRWLLGRGFRRLTIQGG